MKRISILCVLVLACTTLLPATPRAQSIACAAEVPAARKGHWYYRIIDGRKCWYEGKAMMPKSDLYWPKEKIADADPAPVARKPAPSETDGRNAAAMPAPEPVAPPAAAWPSPVAGEISFEQRWLGLRLNR
jgi:hypothetical protein